MRLWSICTRVFSWDTKNVPWIAWMCYIADANGDSPRFIYYFVGDRPVHRLPFDPKYHQLFVILYSILANLSDDMFLLLYI